ncbi:MAG: 4'-phosphopantetheinyl transferase superfamily protein [Paludibacteraceae bacterium]|nr:4'-phosphopantetheinyl transferase superfamily protein [Paludibacteraceae bacterium]
MLVELFDHMTLGTDAEVTRLLPLVSAQRREEALRYQHTHGRFCCLQSYAMLLELIGAVSPTLDYTLPEFVFNEHGKPFIPNRYNLQFSISHTKNAIAVALSSQPVGIDVEQIRSASPALIEKTMNAAEQQQIARSAHPDATFTALWTRKEAVLKLLGTGIIDELHHVLDEADRYVIETHVDIRKGYAWSTAQYAEQTEL